MELNMRDTYRENPKDIGLPLDEQTIEICRRRQIRKLRANYVTAQNFHRALCEHGVQARIGREASIDTAEKMMNGQMPGGFLWLSLMGSDLWPTFQWIYQPALAGNPLPVLEAEYEQQKREMLRREQEIQELDRARKNGRPRLRSIDRRGPP